MGLFDFFTKQDSSNYPVSKIEMQDAQRIAKQLDLLFLNSPSLRQLSNRNEVMHSRMLSYRSMLAYIYTYECNYGHYNEYIDIEEYGHFVLVKQAMSNKAHRNQSIAELPRNWQDILKVVTALSMAEPSRVQPLANDIQKLTSIINRLK